MATRKLGFQPLMQALYTRLTTNALTSAYRVYNYTPKSAAMPFVSFGSPIGVPATRWNTRDSAVEDNSITVHVWSVAEGDKEASQYMDNIIQAILGSDISVVAYFTPFIAYLDMAELFIDDTVPTRLVRHGVMRFRFVMAPS